MSQTNRAHLNTTDKSYAAGVIMVLIGALFASLAGLFVRNIEDASGWTLLFYRSTAFFITVLLFMASRGSVSWRTVRDVGWPGLVIAIVLGGAFVAYIFALRLTTVANAVFILSASPLLASLVAWVILGERPGLITWACMALSAVGVGIMVADGLNSGSLLGSLIAVIALVGYALSVVLYRFGKDRDMMPATAGAGLFAALISGAMATSLAISGHDLVFAVLLGTVQIGGQYILITLAAKRLPAGEIALLMMLEIIAAPIWVWLAFDETPSAMTLAGGALVTAAIGIQASMTLSPTRAKTATP